MKALKQWADFFTSLGVSCAPVPDNDKAITLNNLAGAPLFRAVKNYAELADLHTKARQKSAQMERLLILGLPFHHPGATVRLPGDITLPTCRVYGGHAGSAFSLSGHRIECQFLTELKKEVTRVIDNGKRVQTPLCNWLLKHVGSSWPYGIPSSREQLDGLVSLVAQDPSIIGHVRSRQLSYGRGCADAMLLASEDVVLPSNSLHQDISPADLRFVSLEHETAKPLPQRLRLQAVVSNKFLSVFSKYEPTFAEAMGCNQTIGASVIGAKAPAKAVEKEQQLTELENLMA